MPIITRTLTTHGLFGQYPCMQTPRSTVALSHIAIPAIGRILRLRQTPFEVRSLSDVNIITLDGKGSSTLKEQWFFIFPNQK